MEIGFIKINGEWFARLYRRVTNEQICDVADREGATMAVDSAMDKFHKIGSEWVFIRKTKREELGRIKELINCKHTA